MMMLLTLLPAFVGIGTSGRMNLTNLYLEVEHENGKAEVAGQPYG